MTDTIKAHFENCKQVSQIVDDANALLTKVRDELFVARETLEGLVQYQHPKISMSLPYRLADSREDREKSVAPAYVISRQVARINALLGDRA